MKTNIEVSTIILVMLMSQKAVYAAHFIRIDRFTFDMFDTCYNGPWLA